MRTGAIVNYKGKKAEGFRTIFLEDGEQLKDVLDRLYPMIDQLVRDGFSIDLEIVPNEQDYRKGD